MSGQVQNLAGGAWIRILCCQSIKFVQPCPKCGCLEERHTTADSLHSQQQQELGARIATRHLALIKLCFPRVCQRQARHDSAFPGPLFLVPFQLEYQKMAGATHQQYLGASCR